VVFQLSSHRGSMRPDRHHAFPLRCKCFELDRASRACTVGMSSPSARTGTMAAALRRAAHARGPSGVAEAALRGRRRDVLNDPTQGAGRFANAHICGAVGGETLRWSFDCSLDATSRIRMAFMLRAVSKQLALNLAALTRNSDTLERSQQEQYHAQYSYPRRAPDSRADGVVE
jgi:hypothetical protein